MFTLPHSQKRLRKLLGELHLYEQHKNHIKRVAHLVPTNKKFCWHRQEVHFTEWRDSEGKLYFYDVVNASYNRHYVTYRKEKLK